MTETASDRIGNKDSRRGRHPFARLSRPWEGRIIDWMMTARCWVTSRLAHLRILALAVTAAVLWQGCSLLGANENYLPELGAYDYRLQDTAEVTGTLIVESADGAGIAYRWDVAAFTPGLAETARFLGGAYTITGRLIAGGQPVSHQVSRDGTSYRCAAEIGAQGTSVFRLAPCSLTYRGP